MPRSLQPIVSKDEAWVSGVVFTRATRVTAVWQPTGNGERSSVAEATRVAFGEARSLVAKLRMLTSGSWAADAHDNLQLVVQRRLPRIWPAIALCI